MSFVNGFNISDFFGGNRTEAALEQIKKEGFNIINCALTGSVVGVIADDEIRLCLKMEQERKPLSTPNDLVNEFAMRHYAYSSGPAPSLRIHKDHNTLVRVLRNDPQGPARLFSYMTGRLLFESMLSERERLGTDNATARLYFCIDLLQRLERLPKGWHDSLSVADEHIKAAFNAVALLDSVSGTPDPVLEGKAAQRCLEMLLRLDAIHNLRNHFYNEKLRQRLLALREHDSWTFQSYAKLLDEVESDGIIKLSYQRPRGNPMAITSALLALDVSRKRTGFAMDDFLKSMDKAEMNGRLAAHTGIGTTGSELIADINELLTDPNLSHKDMKPLVNLLAQLNRDINSFSPADRRIDLVKRLIAVRHRNHGKSKVIRGDSASISMARTYIDNKQKLPQALQTKIESIIEVGKVKVPQAVKKVVELPKKPTKHGLTIENVFGNMFDGFGKK